ncbi:MAG: AAA family ATPase [Nocardioidaceae bacterium]|nr:AAA family ATPase [Nocardioidaceae bacterium]
MRCESCGTSNAADNRFCGHCGSPLARICASCGTPSLVDQSFCGQCGARLTESPVPEQAEVPQLRWASVLFVDLVGYTPLTDGWDAEDVREMLSGYFDVARTVVERYGGTVEKFIGDAVVAAWGSRGAREDDTERCVRAGLEIVEAVAGYGERCGLAGLAARAGVVTGQVSAWGTSEGLVAGDRVNLAARVQSVAESGTVFVDEVTMRASRATVAYADAVEHALKGIAGPLRLWRAVRVVASARGVQRVDGLEAAFVGRARELALVKELYHATVESGRARLVAVSGVAGIGKSRLSWEFEKYVDGLAGATFWHRGRCLSYGDGVAFWALAEMVRQRFSIAEDDAADVAAAKVAEGLPQWVPDNEEREFVEPRLGVLVGAVEREFPQAELFAGWRLFLERLAAIQPVVLLVEDLHWADTGLLDFLEYLLDWSAQSAIYLLTFARPELAERRPGWLADRRNATLLHLDPLPDSAIGELLDDLVPGMPEPIKAKISGHAGGIPLYAVETIRSLVDKDLVVPREGVYCLVGEVDDLDVPASLTTVIAARIDGLPANERELVKGLAVLGDSFPRRAVTAVSDLPDEELAEALQALVRKEILAVRADPLKPEQSQYAFVQTMLRSVAYDALTRRERKTRHLAVAAHLRSAFPDDGADVVELIAAHLMDAYAAAGADPDADELRGKASAAFERAGARAGSLGSPDAAEEYYRTAADLTDNEADRTRYTADAAWMAERAGRPADALALLEAATDAHLRAGREVEAARLADTTGWITLNHLGQPERALRQMKAALLVLEREGAQDALADLYPALAHALIEVGEPAAAAKHLERALVLATALEQPDALMAGLHTKATLLATEHRPVEAEALLLAVVKVAHEHDDTEFEARARGTLGWLRVQGDLPAATEELEAALALSRRLAHTGFQVEGLHDLAVSLFYAGRWGEAEGYARQAAELDLRSRWPYRHLPLLLVLAGRGHRAEAEQHFHRLMEVADGDDPDHRAVVGIAQGVMALAQGRLDAALAAAGSAVREGVLRQGLLSHRSRLAWPIAMDAALAADMFDEAESLLALVGDAPRGHVPPYLRAQLARYRALVAAARGQHEDVEADLRRAIDGFRELGYPYWLARVQADLAQWLSGQGREGEAEPLLTEAMDTFTRLGAQPDLERLRSTVPSD